jgi:hypothetical protein
MPTVHYYLGRPASALIAAMSRRGFARETAADSPAVASPASPRTAAPAGRRSAPAGDSAPRITAEAESAWAGHFWSPRPGR